MYIVYEQNRFCLSTSSEGAVAEIMPPAYRMAGEEANLPICTLSEEGTATYEDHRFAVTLTLEQRSDTLFYIHRVWRNTAAAPVRFRAVFRVRPCFTPTRYLIPCVSVNGNEFGGGGEPKGLTRDGQPWIFSYDREAIPSCTVTENGDFACSLFASAESAESLQSACSIRRHENTWCQEIFHPVIEAPLTYRNRDAYAPACEGYLTLGANETFESGFYLSVSIPRWANFGVCATLDSALDVFGDNRDLNLPTHRAVWDNSIQFAKSLISDYKGKKGFNIGFIPDGNGGFTYRGDPTYELAWCGQNILLSRMLVEDYARFDREDSLREALEILDTRAALCTAENGLLAVQLRDFEDLNAATADTCNMGYGAYEYLRVYKRLKELGIEKPAYLAAGKGLCDFFCHHFSPEYGFGKQWRLKGECIDGGGSIGAFVIPALAKAYELTGEEKYLAMAEQSLTFYVERDLNRFVCTAGALDTSCVDKETATPFIIASVLLYKLTGKPVYLEYAEKAAYYFTSWMFHFNPVYAPDDEITRLGAQIKGLTSVSAQHHHADMYAGLAVPYIRELADLTGDSRWRTRADMMWRAVLQFIGDGALTIHGRLRPVGSQNEAVFHCNWGSDPKFFYGGNRGGLNDWLVAWPCAFRLSVLASEENW